MSLRRSASSTTITRQRPREGRCCARVTRGRTSSTRRNTCSVATSATSGWLPAERRPALVALPAADPALALQRGGEGARRGRPARPGRTGEQPGVRHRPLLARRGAGRRPPPAGRRRRPRHSRAQRLTRVGRPARSGPARSSTRVSSPSRGPACRRSASSSSSRSASSRSRRRVCTRARDSSRCRPRSSASRRSTSASASARRRRSASSWASFSASWARRRDDSGRRSRTAAADALLDLLARHRAVEHEVALRLRVGEREEAGPHPLVELLRQRLEPVLAPAVPGRTHDAPGRTRWGCRAAR